MSREKIDMEGANKAEEMEQGQTFVLGWSYGLAWGMAVVLLAGALMLILDKGKPCNNVAWGIAVVLLAGALMLILDKVEPCKNIALKNMSEF